MSLKGSPTIRNGGNYAAKTSLNTGAAATTRRYTRSALNRPKVQVRNDSYTEDIFLAKDADLTSAAGSEWMVPPRASVFLDFGDVDAYVTLFCDSDTPTLHILEVG